MIAELCDFSYDRPTVAEIRAAGRVGVIRYVASGRPAVSASRAEVDSYRAAGLAFVGVWENGPGRALLGWNAGVADARDAAAYCAGLGAGPGDVVYFAVDVDVVAADQFAAVADYMAGAASVLGWDRAGVYGEYDVMVWLRQHTACRWYFQAAAWSGGRLADFANLYQYATNQTLNGKAVDYDRALTANYGQWGPPMPTIYPGCRWTPLGAQTQQRLPTHEVIIVHTMAGFLVSTDNLFRAGNGAGYIGLESHLGVGGKWGPDLGGGLDGAVWQWQDCDYVAEANADANGRAISIETADNAPAMPADIEEWTAAQVDALVALIAWLCRTYNIPARLVPDTKPGTRGIAYHAQGTAANLPAGWQRWSTTVGKPCPTARRINQLVSVVIPRVQQALDQEDNMPLTQADATLLAETLRPLWRADILSQVVAVLRGEGAAITATQVRAVLTPAVAALAAAGQSQSAEILATVRAAPTGHLSVGERQEIATDIAGRLAETGVQVDAAALAAALAGDIAGRLQA